MLKHSSNLTRRAYVRTAADVAKSPTFGPTRQIYTSARQAMCIHFYEMLKIWQRSV